MTTRSALLALALTAPLASAHEIVGYYPGWVAGRDDPFPVSTANIDATRLTVLNYAFLDICWNGRHGNPAPGGDGALRDCQDGDGRTIRAPDGAIVLGDPELDATAGGRGHDNLGKLLALKAVNPKLKLMASIGGWVASNQFSNMAASAATRANFVASAVAFLRRYRFDGIDIDWEFPGAIGLPCASGAVCERASDKPNFVLLARELRTALDRAGAQDHRRYALTIAAGSGRKHVLDAQGSSAWLRALAASLDWINVMTYDYHGTWDGSSGHVAPLRADPRDNSAKATTFNADASISMFLDAGIPADTLVLGLPFYGYGWAGCAAGPQGDGLYQPCSGPAAGAQASTFDFAYLVRQGYLGRDANGRYSVGARGFTRYWNVAAGVPWLYNPASQVFISYEDEASVEAKVRYLLDRGLRGAMFWELNADRDKVLGTVLAQDLPH
jgi:chitinase